MRTTLLTVLFVPMLVAGAFVSGCGNSCDDLAEVCDLCADQSYRESCEATVTDNVQEVCSSVKGDYQATCVGEQGGGSTTSSGTGGFTTSSGTGGSTTSSGTGGSTTSSGTGGAGGSGGAAGGAGGSGGAAGGAGGA